MISACAGAVALIAELAPVVGKAAVESGTSGVLGEVIVVNGGGMFTKMGNWREILKKSQELLGSGKGTSA